MRSLVLHDTQDALGLDILAYLKEKGSDEIRYIDLQKDPLQACTGCFSCWVKTPGICIWEDGGHEILREEMNSNRVLLLCPVTWGGFSPVMKTLLDRSIVLALPFFKKYRGETHHPKRYGKSPTTFLAGYGEDLLPDEIDVFQKTGENLSDNFHRENEKTMIIRSRGDLKQFDRFLKGREI